MPYEAYMAVGSTGLSLLTCKLYGPYVAAGSTVAAVLTYEAFTAAGSTVVDDYLPCSDYMAAGSDTQFADVASTVAAT